MWCHTYVPVAHSTTQWSEKFFFNPKPGDTSILLNCATFHDSRVPKLEVILSLGFPLRELGALRCSQRGVKTVIEGCKHKKKGLWGYLC